MDKGAFQSLIWELRDAATTSDAEKAMATIKKLPTMPVEPTVICYNVAIGVCVRASKLAEATQLLGDLVNSRINPDLMTYNLLISGAARLVFYG